MAAKKQSHHQDKKKKQQQKNNKANQIRSDNFVPDAGLGCHIARYPNHDNNNNKYNTNNGGDTASSSSWVLGWESIDDPSAYGDETTIIPDIGIDADEHTISLCNMNPDHWKVAYISVYNVVLHGKHGRAMRQGYTTTTTTSSTPKSSITKEEEKVADDSTTQPGVVPCTTLIVLCPPLTFCHLCKFPCDPRSLRLESDVQVWNAHPDPPDTCDRILGFPISAVYNNSNNNSNNDDDNDDDASAIATRKQYLCTQGEGGTLTHFFRGNYHGVDFQCDIGTPLLAVGNGTVIAVQDNNTKISGIGVSNLYQWNSILLQLDQTDLPCLVVPNSCDRTKEQEHNYNEMVIRPSSELFVEYVHIQASLVRPGDRVQKGDVIGTSGSAGFSPEPHLHFAAYRSQANDAPTCRVYFESNVPDQTQGILPIAGQLYPG